MSQQTYSTRKTQARSLAKPESVTEGSGNLEKLVSFIQENWKSILTELVGAGVTAYLQHSAKEKSKTATRQ